MPTLLPDQYNHTRLSWQWVAVWCARWADGGHGDRKTSTKQARGRGPKKRARRQLLPANVKISKHENGENETITKNTKENGNKTTITAVNNQ